MRCCKGLEARVTTLEARAEYASRKADAIEHRALTDLKEHHSRLKELESRAIGQSDYLRKVDLANETHEADLMDLRNRTTELEQVIAREGVRRRGEAMESWVKRALEKELAGPVPGFDREEAAEETSGFNRAEWHEASSDYWQARSEEAESELDELKLKSSERRSEDRRNIERLERRVIKLEKARVAEFEKARAVHRFDRGGKVQPAFDQAKAADRINHLEGVIRRKDDHFEERGAVLKEQVREAEARAGKAENDLACVMGAFRYEPRDVETLIAAARKLEECLDLGNDQPCSIGCLRKLREALAPFTGDKR